MLVHIILVVFFVYALQIGNNVFHEIEYVLNIFELNVL